MTLGEELEKISAIIPDEISKRVMVILERCESAEIRVEWFGPDGCRIIILGSKVPDELCRTIMERLRDVGVEKIELRTWGWWLGEEEYKPDEVLVSDHVACHKPSPLTGTEEAARGDAFIRMRRAYSTEDPGNPGVRQAVLWHTSETESLSETEIETAKAAGCEVASPDTAGWAVCARAAGIEISAMVRIAD
jgi:hypothetical protein